MRVAVYHNNRDVRLEDRPRPSIGPGELLVRIEASGICGSDVMEWYRIRRAPLVLGHEVAGEIVEVGAGVQGFALGDRVVTTHHVPCGDCLYCRTDRHSVCETLRRTTFDPGGFSELVRLPAINVTHGTFRLPDHVGFDEASFVEPLACAIRAQRIARVQPGITVAVLGSGVSGILQLQLARVNGAARIVATDVSDYKLEAAERFGADATIRADAVPDVPAAIRAANDDRPADLVIVCTGALPAIEQAFASVDLGGAVLLFAPADPGVTWPLPLQELWSRGIQILHSYAGPPDDMRAALALIADGKVDVASMVTHRLGLAETGEAFRMMVDGEDALKVIVEPQR
jgi:L-iditol 2-dehydrogenase